MPIYYLPYGHEKKALTLPDDWHVDWIEPEYIPPAPDPLAVVDGALANPVDGRELSFWKEARSVAIAVNDKTRPVPHEMLLPPLLDAIHAAGIPTNAVTFFIATGTHLPMEPAEFPRILSDEICAKYQVVSHNCDDENNLAFLGTTSRGTPIWGNRQFVSSDLKIVVGNIEPHHFAGFSGGYKTAAIGLAGRASINPNHAMLIDPDARMGLFENNPLRQDIEEIGAAMGVDFALNAILNGEKQIVQALSGHPEAVIRAGIPISQDICQVTVQVDEHNPTRRYDLVVASVGGAPKDINFYQSQKALTHASLFARDGGVIIIVAECPEGSGSRTYESFMEDVSSVAEVYEKFRREGFQVGPHKAFQVAREAARTTIILFSSISPGLVSHLLMSPAASLDQAVQIAKEKLSPALEGPIRAAVLPRATNTIPVFKEGHRNLVA